MEHTEYLLVVDGTNVYGSYEGKEALNAARPKAEEIGPVRVWSDTFLEEDAEARAKHNVNSQIDGVLDALKEKYPKHELVLRPVLTGSGNFRERVATIRPYKGNRSAKARPQLYGMLRTHLVDKWDAEIVHGHEADDEVAIRQTTAHEEGRESLIVHVDKDLNQVPGLHYNPNKGFASITAEWGLRFFYRQIIEGDNSDNVGGVYKSGAKRAKEVIVPGMSEREMYEACAAEFVASRGKYGAEKCGYDNPVAACNENAVLLWMLRKPGALWTMPPLQGAASVKPVPSLASQLEASVKGGHVTVEGVIA